MREAQEFAVGSVWVEEHVYERDEQQSVARVSKGYANGVGVEGDGRAEHVIVVRRLVEAHRSVSEDAVHRHLAAVLLAVVDDCELRHVVFCRVGAFMVLHIEAVEAHLERHLRVVRLVVTVVHHAGTDVCTLTQMNRAALRTDVCHESARKYHHEREVERYARPRLAAVAQEIDDASGREHSPKQREPPCAVHIGAHKVGSAILFHYCSGCHADYHQNIQREKRLL